MAFVLRLRLCCAEVWEAVIRIAPDVWKIPKIGHGVESAVPGDQALDLAPLGRP